MSRNAFLSGALYEGYNALKKFTAAPRGRRPTFFTKWRTEQTVNRKCMFYFDICIAGVLTACVFVHVCTLKKIYVFYNPFLQPWDKCEY